MNKTAIEMLEYNKIRALLADYAITEKGKELINHLEPAIDKQVIEHLLKETAEAKAIINKSSSVPLHSLVGIDKIIDKLEMGLNLSPTELTNILGLIDSGNKMKKFLKDKEILAPMVVSYSYSIFELKDLAEKIAKSIRYDQVDDNASPKLAKIRKRIAIVEERIKAKLDNILKSSSNSDYIQENIVSLRNGRYVIPVKRAYKNNISGNVLDTSASGSTVFIEPEAVTKLQEELNLLKLDEDKEIFQILTFLTGLVEGYKRELQINIETMIHYDFIFAKAKYSKAIAGNIVQINTDKYINIKGAKHPLLGNDAVPIDFTIGRDYRSLIITGPNTGGKTVALKTVGLLTMMVQSGLQVPVELGSIFTIFNNILVDIGDGQSIEQSLSTFSSHLRNIISIMEWADKNTLVILDELGAGTDPGEGMGLAISIIENIHSKNAITIATTHYSEIKVFAEETAGFENGSMEFDIETLRPTYKLNIGRSGESNAFLIALRLGMNKAIIERAHEITYKEKKEYNSYESKATQHTPQKLNNADIKSSQLVQQEKEHRQMENKKSLEKQKKKTKYNIGDAVFIPSLDSVGIVCELENNKGELGVMVKRKKLKVNIKRVNLYIEGKDLYPEDYDLDIVLETKENRKKRNLMKRKYVKDVVIEKEGN